MYFVVYFASVAFVTLRARKLITSWKTSALRHCFLRATLNSDCLFLPNPPTYPPTPPPAATDAAHTHTHTHTQEQHVRAIRRYFNLFDTDGSKSIEIGELSSLAEALGDRLTRRELDEAFDELDANGNGRVSFPEFIEWWKAA